MKKETLKKTGIIMVTKKIMAALLIIVAASSCKKDKPAITVAIHNYEGQWENIVPAPTKGPLDFFNLSANLVNDGTGTLYAAYIQPANQYPSTNLIWQKIGGDSVVITLNIPAYPNEKWELRGLASDDNTKIIADYFSTPNNNPEGKHKYGTLVMNKL